MQWCTKLSSVPTVLAILRYMPATCARAIVCTSQDRFPSFSVLVAVAALRASAVALCGGPSGFRCPPVFQLLFGFPCDGLKRCAILMAREIGNSAAPAGALFPVRAQPHRFPWASPQPPRQIGEGCCGLAGSWNSATASWQPVLY